MDREDVPAPHPANLRPGAVVGPFRVVGWSGRGVYGTGKWQVALNGGCWKQLPLNREECEAINGQLFKGTCYMPITAAGRSPTSSPTRDP
jgi:hypothetical protein